MDKYPSTMFRKIQFIWDKQDVMSHLCENMLQSKRLQLTPIIWIVMIACTDTNFHLCHLQNPTTKMAPMAWSCRYC